MRKEAALRLVGLATVVLLVLTFSPAARSAQGGSAAEEVKIAVKKLDGTVVEKKIAKPRYGGTLRLALDTDILGFDQAKTTGSPAQTRTLNYTNDEVLRGDWRLGPVGAEETDFYFTASQFFPHYQTGSLAESWEVPDPGTLILNVRKGVHFHDKPPTSGRALVADDIVYTINRVYVDVPKAYHQISFPPEQRPLSVKALDKDKVEIKCNPGMVGTMMCAALHFLRIVPREVVDKYGDMKDWRNSCGTGPFMLTDYVVASAATLERNPNYWMKDPLVPENTLPYIDTLKLLIVPDASTRLAALRTGKLDHLMYVTTEDARTVMDHAPDVKWKKGLQIHPNNSIWFKIDAKPFDDIRVRRALAMALDNEAVAKDYYLGEAVILNNPVPPVKEYEGIYTSLDKLPESSRELYGYHPEKAKQLLAEAGYPNGFKTNITCYQQHVDLLSIVASYWAKVGVQLDIDIKEYSVYTSFTLGKKFTQMAAGWTVDANPFRFHNYRVGSLYNYAQVNDSFINQVYDKMQYSANLEEWGINNANYKPIVPYIIEQCWSIELPTPYLYTLWWPWVKNYGGEYCVGFEDYMNWPEYVWIDQEMREKKTGAR